MSTDNSLSGVPRVALVTPPSDVAYGSNVAQLLRATDPRVHIARHDPVTGDFPTPTNVDHIIVTGSTARVDDPDPWIADLSDHVRTVLDAGTPVLGVCFGHQLLARSLGGDVATLPRRAAGYHAIRSTDHGRRHPLFRELPDPIVGFRWHRDHVVTLPPDAFALAHASDTIQAFADRNRPAVGVQFHPEVGPETASALVESLPIGERDAARHTLTDAAVERATRTRQLYANAVWGAKHTFSAI